MKSKIEKMFDDISHFEKNFIIRYGDGSNLKYFFVEEVKEGKLYGKPINFEIDVPIEIKDIFLEDNLSFASFYIIN